MTRWTSFASGGLAVAALLAGCGSKGEDAARPVVEVKVARAERTDLQIVVRAPATVFPREQANIAPRLTATIRELKARKGDSVRAAQTLGQLENRDLLAQRREAAASVADAEATLEKLSAGTLPSDMERARGQVATTGAALNQARKFYERRKQLFEQGAIPNRDLLVSETELAQARTNHEVARKALELLEGQSRERDLQIARSRVEQARGRLAYIEAQLVFAEIRSPFAGTITEQFLFPGDMAGPDAAIFTVADLSVAVARAQVPEPDAGSIRAGASCSLVPADRPEARLPGRISVVNQAVDPARRTVEVWCEIPNGNHALRAGVFGALEVLTRNLARVIAVPVAAVQLEEGGRRGTVVVVDSRRKAARREVEIGERAAGRLEIRSGLRGGETVIVEGGYGLPEGTEVTWQ